MSFPLLYRKCEERNLFYVVTTRDELISLGGSQRQENVFYNFLKPSLLLRFQEKAVSKMDHLTFYFMHISLHSITIAFKFELLLPH